jgi:hypothetical protein
LLAAQRPQHVLCSRVAGRRLKRLAIKLFGSAQQPGPVEVESTAEQEPEGGFTLFRRQRPGHRHSGLAGGRTPQAYYGRSGLNLTPCEVAYCPAEWSSAAEQERRTSAPMKKKPFNITLIASPDYPHSLALAEVAEYLAHLIGRCGFKAELSRNAVSKDFHNVILCGHMLSADALASLPGDTILFNSEPLADAEGWQFANGVYRQALDRFYVWDYSQANLKRLEHRRKSLIPLLYCGGLVRRKLAREPGDTLVFYGSLTSRREKFLQSLHDAGVKTRYLYGVYGEERDRIVFRSWAVLNLHKLEHVDVFEPVRCFYLLTNRIPVISEEFRVEPWLEPFKDSMFTLPTDALCRQVCELYRDTAGFQAQCKRQAARFRLTDPLPAMRDALAAYVRTATATMSSVTISASRAGPGEPPPRTR